MVTGSIWVDCGGLDKKRDGSQKESVLFLIELEFLIFMMNILTIAVFLLLKYYLTWIDGVGLKFIWNMEFTDDLLEKDVKTI
jgi:hypothetical protein